MAHSKVQTQNVSSWTCLLYKSKIPLFFSLSSYVGWCHQLPTQKSEIISESTVSFSLMYPVKDLTSYGFGNPSPVSSCHQPCLGLHTNYFPIDSLQISCSCLSLPRFSAPPPANAKFTFIPDNVIHGKHKYGHVTLLSNVFQKISKFRIGIHLWVQFPIHRVYTEICFPVLQKIKSLIKYLMLRRTWICGFSPRQITFHKRHGNDQTWGRWKITQRNHMFP